MFPVSTGSKGAGSSASINFEITGFNLCGCGLMEVGVAYSVMADSDDDDVPRLSADTLAALQDFYKEQKDLEELESDLSNSKKFQENWVQYFTAMVTTCIIH